MAGFVAAWLIMAGASGQAAGGEKSRAKITVETITHKMWTAELEEKRLYPKPVDKSALGPARQAIRDRENQLQQELAEQHPDLAKAYDAYRKIGRRQRNTAEARKLQPGHDAFASKLREAKDADEKLESLREKYRQARRSNWKVIDAKIPMVTLSNALIEVKVAPTLGMRVVNAVDLKTGLSFSGSSAPRYYEKQPFQDVIGWTAGYQELSFPYFEHGVGVRQSAGFRTIEHDDGSVTVAMNMRFTEHQHPRHMARYGRYSQRSVSIWVTLRPGESRYSATYRLDNPNPLRRSERMWTNILMEAEKYDGEHVIYPVGYIMPHMGGWAKPFYAEGGQRSWRGVSHFGLYSEYEFCGVYSPRRDNNCLIITPSDTAPGMKLYTTKAPGGFLEFWTGSTTLFEYPGRFVDPYEPVEYRLDFYNVQGIGRVDFANRDVAIAEEDGSFAIVCPRSGSAKVTDGAGKTLAEGKVGPHTPLKGSYDKRLVVTVDGRQVADVTFPLTYKDTQRRHGDVKALGGKYRIELEEISNHRGQARSWHGIREAEKLLKQDADLDKELLLSYANCCYRYGRFDLAERLLERIGSTPGADHLRGLIAWERGEKVDFGQAGPDSYYHRALLAIQDGKEGQAIDWLEKLIAKRPEVYRPRLVLAYLKEDREAAGKLAMENPASPEAQLVLAKLGVDGAEKAWKSLVEENPGASEQVKAFGLELTEGKWSHIKRYQPLVKGD